MSTLRISIKRCTAISCLFVLAAWGASAQAQSAPSSAARAFADRMITCNSHALLLTMYAQGKVPASVPARAEYRDIAYAAAGEAYVMERLISEDEMNKAIAELEPLLSTESGEGMTEPQKDEFTYSAWTKIINACNETAAHPPKTKK